MVDRLLLEKILGDIRANIRELEIAKDIPWEVYQSDVRTRRFVERTLHILIEACIDIAQHIISDEGFREPSTYRDAFVVLAEEKIIPADQLPRLEQMAAFRNLIVHYYEKIDDTIVFAVFQRNLTDFLDFTESISAFLKGTVLFETKRKEV
jgi:uncharacterized protein YutE (UPF0331/DUF86 family)